MELDQDKVSRNINEKYVHSKASDMGPSDNGGTGNHPGLGASQSQDVILKLDLKAEMGKKDTTN